MSHPKVAGFLIFIFLLTLPFFSAEATRINHNVWGWAWASNIGWISFNSYNCDPNEDGRSEGAAGCPSAGTSIPDYGVNINTSSGAFSGFAWSSNIGWISFEPASVLNCPGGGTCPVSVNYDAEPKEISGFARACSVFQSGCSGSLKTNRGEWDGWIKMRGIIPVNNVYGVSADTSSNPVQFHGYAWGGNEGPSWDEASKRAVVGWISFNCAEGGVLGGNICSTRSNYKVVTSYSFNRLPFALDPSSSVGDNCGASYPVINLVWVFDDDDSGDTQSAYQVQITSQSDSTFSNPIIDTGKVVSGSVTYTPIANDLDYNSVYRWRVKVWDNHDGESDWAGALLGTPLHRYPWPEFTFDPLVPSVGEVTYFTDNSTCWDNSNNSYPCKEKATNGYLWDFGDFQTSPQRGDTDHIYVSQSPAGGYLVSLSVTDDIGTCTTPDSSENRIGVRLPLPEYKEIPPVTRIMKFLSSLGSMIKFPNIDLIFKRM